MKLYQKLFVAAALFACAAPAPAEIIVATDFTGRTVSGDTASNISYTRNGVADPGDLTAIEREAGDNELAGLFDTAAAANLFAPDLNTGNEGNWSVTLPLTLTVPELSVSDVVLDGVMLNNSGGYQNVVRHTDFRLRIIGAVSGTVADQTLTASSAGGGTASLATAGWQSPLTYTFGGSSILLDDDETWSLLIATDNPVTDGNNTALGSITVNGIVPEPMALPALGMAGLLLLRRRTRATLR